MPMERKHVCKGAAQECHSGVVHGEGEKEYDVFEVARGQEDSRALGIYLVLVDVGTRAKDHKGKIAAQKMVEIQEFSWIRQWNWWL